MSKTSCSKFLKQFDRYDKTVSLKYKKLGSFETAIGGACSILAFTLLTYWLTVNFWDTFTPPGTFTISNTVKLIESQDGTYPEMYVPFERLFTTYSLASTQVPEGDNINDYMVGLWFQQNEDQTLTVYQGVECETLYDEVKVERKELYREQIEGQMCPDMVNGGMRLRNNLKDSLSAGAETFHFAIDTCENFKVYTNSDSC